MTFTAWLYIGIAVVGSVLWSAWLTWLETSEWKRRTERARKKELAKMLESDRRQLAREARNNSTTEVPWRRS